MSVAPIQLHLTVGDALAYPADLAFIGDGPNLIDRIERESGCKFSPLVYPEHLVRKKPNLDGLRHVRELEAPGFCWKRVIALGARPSRRVRKTYISEWLDVMFLPSRSVATNEMVIVPYQRYPAEVVALTQLTLIWCIHRLRVGKKRFRRPLVTRIVDAEDVSLYLQFATSRWSETAEFIDRQLERLWWAPPRDSSVAVEFEVVSS